MTIDEYREALAVAMRNPVRLVRAHLMRHENWIYECDGSPPPWSYTTEIEIPITHCWIPYGLENLDEYWKLSHDHAHRTAWRIWSGADIPKGRTINHQCHIKACVNAHLDLKLGTYLENALDAIAIGRWRNSDSQFGGFSPEDILQILLMERDGLLHYQIAAKYKVHRTTISSILRGDTYDLPDDILVQYLRKERRERQLGQQQC